MLRVLDGEEVDLRDITLGQISIEKIEGAVAGLDGIALNAMDVASQCHAAGFTDALELWKALATFASESLYHTRAFHHNQAVITTIKNGTVVGNVETGERVTIVDAATGKIRYGDGTTDTVPLTTKWVVSTDWGPCQLNDDAHPEFFPGGDPDVIACNPEKCFAAAHDIYIDWGKTFNAWYGWKNGVALDDYYLRRASLGLANYTASVFRRQALARPDEIAGRTTPETKTRATMITLAEFRKIYPPGT